MANLIEQYITENISLETWKTACSASPESNEVCGWVLAAIGLVDFVGDAFVDVSIGGEPAEEYVAAYFAAAEKFDEAA